MAIASISAPSRAPDNPSVPGAARRLPATAARSVKLRTICRTGCWITRSARGPGRVDHDHGVAGADQPAVHFGAHFLRDDVGIDGVPDHRRADEQDQFGSRPRRILMREGIADAGNRIQYRNALSLLVFGLADQAREQYGLAAIDRNRTLHPALRYRRRQIWRSRGGSAPRGHVADLLLDIEYDVAVGVGARQ